MYEDRSHHIFIFYHVVICIQFTCPGVSSEVLNVFLKLPDMT